MWCLSFPLAVMAAAGAPSIRLPRVWTWQAGQEDTRPCGFLLQVSSVQRASSDGSEGVLYCVLVIAPGEKEPFRHLEAFKSEGLLRIVTLATVGGPL